MSCERYQEMISAFIDDELPAEEKISLQNHLDDCKSCRELMEEIRQMRDLISSEKAARMPADVEKQVLRKISDRYRERKGLLAFIGGYYRVPRGAAWATLILLVALAVNAFVSPFSPPRRAEISYDFLSSDIRIQKIELTEADVIGVRTFIDDNNGS